MLEVTHPKIGFLPSSIWILIDNLKQQSDVATWGWHGMSFINFLQY